MVLEKRINKCGQCIFTIWPLSPLGERLCISFKLSWIPCIPKDSLYELAWWFCRRWKTWNIYIKTDDRHQLMQKGTAHLSFQLRWAKTMIFSIQMCSRLVQYYKKYSKYVWIQIATTTKLVKPIQQLKLEFKYVLHV